jgi:uncharacterized protein (TIGR01777 family)
MMIQKKIALIGSGGTIGKELVKYLEQYYEIKIIKSKFLYVDAGILSSLIEGVNIIINLAGYPISGRWNKKKKRLIYSSRIETTRNLVTAIAMMETKPELLISASAIGIYGDGELCDENSTHFANNFLSKLVSDWEEEASKVKLSGVSLSILRLGVVLSLNGGAYKLLRKVYKIGAGGILGKGNQGFSFILIDDLLKIIHFVIEKNLTGIINAVCPAPVTNAEFSKELSCFLNRPAIIPTPAFVLKLVLGEGHTVLLDGQLVIPARLLQNGFSFVGNNLNSCLKILEK